MRRLTSKNLILLVFLAALLGFETSCSKKTEEEASTTTSRYLYFSSGGCFVGNYTGSRPSTATSSGLINRIALDSAQAQGTAVIDYNILGVNFWPNGITDLDSEYLLAAVSTTTAGVRIDKIRKSGLQDKQDYITDVVNLNGILRKIVFNSDSSVLISKSTGIEKYNSSANRVLNATLATSFAVIPTTGSSCSSTSSNLTAILTLPNNYVFFANGFVGFAKVGILNPAGYSAATDCKSAVSFTGTPSSAAQPTAAVLIPNTSPYQVLVATASTTLGNDQIWLFTVEPTTGVISFVKSLYNDTSYVRGISAMAYDSVENTLYVASGATIAVNTIEKLNYDSTARTLTRASTFFPANTETQCINSMFVGN